MDSERSTREKGPIVMKCIWAASLELSWGILALRILVKNVQAWVQTHIKPKVATWIYDIRFNTSQLHVQTPNGGVIQQRRRAVSCEPLNDVPTDTSYSPSARQIHTPRGTGRPHLAQSNTAPAAVRRRPISLRTPLITLNDRLRGLGISGREEPEHSSDDSWDEGYASYTDTTRANRAAGRGIRDDFIEYDEPSEDDSDGSYIPPSSDEDSSGTDSAEDEESSREDSEAQGDTSDEFDTSDGEIHQHELLSRSRNNPDIYCTSSRGHGPSKQARSHSRRYRHDSSIY